MPDFWDYENLGSGEQAFDDYFLRQSDNQFKIPSTLIKDTLFIEFEVSNVTCDNVPRVQYTSAPAAYKCVYYGKCHWKYQN